MQPFADTKRFLLSGSGGQGVITMAIVLAEAAVMHEGLNAVQTQSYGPEARGGATRSDVIIASSEILYPKVEQPNILVALTNEAANKYLSLIRPGGLCIYDEDLVQPGRRVDARFTPLPLFRRTKAAFGRSTAFNVTVLGALAALTGLVRTESLQKVLETRFAPAYHASNLAALELGEELAME